jgi:hypothetical protein
MLDGATNHSATAFLIMEMVLTTHASARPKTMLEKPCVLQDWPSYLFILWSIDPLLSSASVHSGRCYVTPAAYT